MSDLVKCDNCGKALEPRGMVGWWTINDHSASVDVVRLGVPSLAGDYCSTRCVAVRATNIAGPANASENTE